MLVIPGKTTDAVESGIGAKVSPTRLNGLKVISGDNGFTTRALAGRGTVTGIGGIRVVIPTPPLVAAGTVGSTGAGNKVENKLVVGTAAVRKTGAGRDGSKNGLL
jgi:hypothetical protein